MRRFLPSLSALHAFDASVRYLSFTRASENLGMTQSGVSRQIQNLESFLGLKLFERAGPRLVLTEEGQNYYEEVSRILAKLEEVSMDAVRGYKTQSLLKVGLPPTLMRKWAPGIISTFARSHPQIWFEVFPCSTISTGGSPISILPYCAASATGPMCVAIYCSLKSLS